MGAQVVLDHLHPYPDPKDTGYRSELRLEDFEVAAERKIARRALTAGSNMRLVERAIYDRSRSRAAMSCIPTSSRR